MQKKAGPSFLSACKLSLFIVFTSGQIGRKTFFTSSTSLHRTGTPFIQRLTLSLYASIGRRRNMELGIGLGWEDMSSFGGRRKREDKRNNSPCVRSPSFLRVSRRRILLLRKSGHNKFAPLRSKLETHCMGTCVNVDPQSGFTYPETLKDLAKQKSKTVCEIL